ncbi:hypothetical protein MMC07_004958 [Pseudocyphellaria aurata]|nr:hypothetical protein [Pseudocyphellaria aurata]
MRKQISLLLTFGERLTKIAIEHALDLVDMTLEYMIQQRGPGELSADRDPALFETSDHVMLYVQSERPRQWRLTYSLLLATTHGLRDVLIHQGRFHAVTFEIVDATVGRIGQGSLQLNYK